MSKPLPDCIHQLCGLCLPLGEVQTRPMFGGHGLYLEGVMFALEADGVIYLKVDKETKPDFQKTNSVPFVYEGKNKPVEMSYWRCPSDSLISTENFLPWAERALAAAKRAKSKKKK